MKKMRFAVVLRRAGLNACAAFVAFWAGSGALQAQSLPALETESAAEWPMIGIVNGSGQRGPAACTGTLVAADLVLTAAHCVGDVQRPRYFVLRALGVENQISIPSQGIEIHPEYENREGLARFAVDQALITLATPVPARLARPLPLAGPFGRPELGIIAYARARPAGLHGQLDCAQVLPPPEDQLMLACPVVSGNSGAPALERVAQGWSVRGVVVARVGAADKPRALVAPLGDWALGTIRARLDNGGQ